MQERPVESCGRSERGITMIDAVFTLFLFQAFAATFIVAGRHEGLFVTRSREEAVATRLATSHLDLLSSTGVTLAPGRRELRLEKDAANGLQNALLEETVEEREPGLFRVALRLRFETPGTGVEGHVELETLICKEVE